jgi:hypothetical protein
MSNNLSLYELEAISRKCSKEIADRKKAGEAIVGPFSEQVDVTVHVNAAISRGPNTEVTPTFKLANILEPVLLRYANETDNPEEFLQAMRGVITATVQLGPEAVLSTVPDEIKAVMEDIKKEAKELHHKVSKKAERAGNTVVAGSVERVESRA